MKVSIIIPVYNAEKYVCKAIISVVNQTYKNIEILIADDGSTDNSKINIEEINDPRIRLFHNSYNIGKVHTVNKLLSHSTGDFISFLDADDWYALNKVELQVEQFRLNPYLGMVGCNTTYFDNNVEIFKSNYPTSYKKIKERMFPNYQLSFCCNSIMITRAVYTAIGGYSELFNRLNAEDQEFISRIVKTFPAINLKEHLYFCNFSENSMTRTVLTDPIKIHAEDIFLYIHKMRYKNNLELSLESEEVKQFINKIKNSYSKDPSKIYRSLMRQYLSQHKFYKGFLEVINAINVRPLFFKNYFFLGFFILYISIYRNRKIYNFFSSIYKKMKDPTI